MILFLSFSVHLNIGNRPHGAAQNSYVRNEAHGLRNSFLDQYVRRKSAN